MPRILVADDNTNIQKMIALAFSDRGIEVISVGNGEAAVRRMPDVAPDLVLADVFMPVRNGYEVCEFVKKDTRFAHVPVILLVGAFDPLDEKEARRVGADGVLKKPFVPPDPLIAMVMSALEKNPKLAAELAKAREVIPEAPLPAIMEIPAKAEPKPLPDYPEPTAEEAAVIYGFGSSKRSADRGAPAMAPPAAAPTLEDEAADDGVESSMTASDWRHAANEIEVPEGLGGTLSFSADADFDSSIFPSELDVPPKRVRAAAETPEAAEVPPEAGDNSFFVEQADAATGHDPALDLEASAGSEELAPMPAESEPQPEASFAEKSGKWMEMMGATPSEYADDDWLKPSAALSAPQAASVAAFPAPEAPAAPAAAATEEPAPQAGSEGFFADSPEPTEAQEAAATPPAESWFAAPPALHENPVKADSPVDFSSELVQTAEENTGSAAIAPDPALVRPPSVHVTPEPLLVDESEGPSADYGSASEEMSPLHSFLNSHAVTAPQDEPEPPQPDAFSERIPTAAPSNREALSDIPFLTPPELAAPAAEAAAVDQETINAVVRQVLEKLEPQLHELLAQGMVKPLVENMLQTAKKEK
ncbi:MAG TPA: response regulator [Candidatus Acidoferrales bacterium]|nr:response regulator [Candidatus Acidoferrales bacterium]